MKIKHYFAASRETQPLLERLREVAEARGLTEDEALRQALDLWLEKLGHAEPDYVAEVTEKESYALRAMLDAIREVRGAQG